MRASASHRDDLENRVLLQYAVSRALAESETVGEATSSVLREIGTHLGWDVGAFWLVDRKGSALFADAVWPGGAGAFREETLRLKLSKGQGLPGMAWKAAELRWIADVQTLDDFPRARAAAAEGLHAGLAFPVCAGSQTLGVIEFLGAALAEPDDSMKRTLGGLGFQIGEFIDRKRAIEAEHVSRQLMAATLEVALDSVVSIDVAGCILEFNPAAERTFGYKRGDVLGKQMSDLIVPPSLRERHRRGMARYLATGEAHVLGKRIAITGMRADGSEFPIELSILRVPVAGAPVFTAYIRDLTEQTRLELAQRLLLQASTTLASSLDYEQTLRNLSAVVVPSIADWYAADVVEADGTVHRIEVAHRDPVKVELARELAARYPPNVNDVQGVHEVIRTGKSQMMKEIPDAFLTRAAVDDEHGRVIRALGLRSYIIVPLRTRTEIVGALTLVTAESGRRYDEKDLPIAEELGRQAAQAIENSRLFAALSEQRELLEQQATELEAQSAELEETADELEITVEDLRASNLALQQRTREAETARTEADGANKAKSAFLASMSHELRTPLNAIIGYSQLLEIGVHGSLEPKQAEDLGRITRSAQHLLGLINDILNFAKVEAGRVEFDIESLAIRPLLSRVEEMIAPQAHAKNLSYVAEVECDGARACADPEKLMQVMVNILSNAVRYTEPGGEIRIHCHATDDEVITAVSDTGVGIPADKLEAIFEPFVQVNQEYSGQHQGTGLGLAISRDLARAMGGELTVSSTLGKGSTFTLTLRRDRSRRK